MSDEVASALNDVRKSYRLVYLYIASIRDTVERIAQEFNCNFYLWTPSGYEITPKRTTEPFSRWAWDMLPMYNTSFLFLSEDADPNQQKTGDWLFDIYIETDSAFDSDVQGEPNPIEFGSSENTESTFTLQVIYCTKPDKFNWYYGFWNNCEYPDEEIDMIEGYKGLKYIGRSYELSKVYDEKTILECIADFKHLLKDNLPLKDI